MQYFIGFLATVLVPLIPSIAKGLATYVALSVGFSLVAYTGVSVAMDSIADYIQSNMNGVTPNLLRSWRWLAWIPISTWC